ncbi:MAG: ribokinase [Thermoleophilia bacterium]|nr:ribokinase [Thermoleophilia bacterium]
MRRVRTAVVGHVEWVEFVRLPHWPAAGEIIHATDLWSEPAGGGAVVARQLALLAGRCELFTAFGEDDAGRSAVRRLAELGVDVHVQHPWRSTTRRAWTQIDDRGERTIIVLGDKLLPRGSLPLEDYDLVFFISGDAAALRAARRARYLAATLREQGTLHEAGVPIDLLIGSANDPGEQYDGSLDAGLVVITDGPNGGTANGEPFAAVEPRGPVVDTYGAGDSFAAALAFALARGDALAHALDLAARAGAAVLTGRGPYTSQLAFGQ